MKLLVLSKHDCKMYEKKEIKYLSGRQETRHGRRSSDTLTTQQQYAIRIENFEWI